MANIRTGRKSGFVNRGGLRRETLWLAGTYASTTIAASTAVIVSSLNAAALALRPFTVVRARGLLMLESDQIAAAERLRCAYGVAVVSDQASAIGVTAVPTPTTDDGSDLWFLYQTIAHSVQVTAGQLAVGPAYHQVEMDSKAMRKVEDGMDIVTVVEQGAAVGAILTNYIRLLIKLH